MFEYQKAMLTEERGAEIRDKITKKTHKVKYYNPKGLESKETPGTSEIASVDSEGLAISMTTTINLLFGSLVVVPETGIIMNNEMNDFSIPGESNAFGYIPSPHNYVKPGKRPLSSISCTIATRKCDGSLAFITGSAGGSRIITATAQTLFHSLSQNMTAHEAVKHPRIHDQLEPNTIYVETTYDNSTIAFLKARGAKITYEEPGSSSVQAIRVLEDGSFEPASETRQKNSAGIAI
jgi:gamma-glutamyltranspeptidase / glutathione hydrolase